MFTNSTDIDENNRMRQQTQNKSPAFDRGVAVQPLMTTEQMEERQLSQKMNDLMMTTNLHDMNDDTNIYLYLDKTIRDRLNTIPNYLTKGHPTFQTIVDKALGFMGIPVKNVDIEHDLLEISRLIYKTSILTLYSSLWTTYWKSGMGLLITQSSAEPQRIVSYPTDISIWPKAIKRMQKSFNGLHGHIYASSTKIVEYHRQELEQLLKQTQMIWREKKNHFYGYNSQVEQLLQDYVEKHLSEFHHDIQHQITLVTYDYHIEALKYEFNQQNPTAFQKKLMKQTCLMQNEKETAEQELKFLQERIAYFQRSGQSYDYAEKVESTLIGSMENTELRQILFQEYQNIIEKARTDFSAISLQAAEDDRNRTRVKYNNLMSSMWNLHAKSMGTATFELPIITLITERSRMIGERIQAIYKYKIERFHLTNK